MAEDTLSSEFYWNTIIFKVEDKLFCVPACEFVQSSQVFADMFLLPSGPATCSEGQDREHPIVLEGYKKNEFACLLRVMYPTAGSLISGTNLELCLEEEEWVSVLKLSTIWGMKKIRQYAIHRLSTDVTLSPSKKILLGREHRVAEWVDEGVTCLANRNIKLALEDLATLGWETAARILWIRDYLSPPITSNTLSFKRDAIKCGSCSSSSNLINCDVICHYCRRSVSADDELIFPGPGSPLSTPSERLVAFREISCNTQNCGRAVFFSTSLACSSCSFACGPFAPVNVRISPNLKKIIQEIFGEIKDYELDSMAVV